MLHVILLLCILRLHSNLVCVCARVCGYDLPRVIPLQSNLPIYACVCTCVCTCACASQARGILMPSVCIMLLSNLLNIGGNVLFVHVLGMGFQVCLCVRVCSCICACMWACADMCVCVS